MNCAISTGQWVTGSSVAPVSPPTGAPVMAKNVLFGPLSTSLSSRLIYVGEGQSLLLTGHTFGVSKITAERVFYTPGAMPQASQCTPCVDHCVPADPGKVTATKPLEVNCTRYELSTCNDTMAITIPGYYVFTLDSVVGLGTVYLEYQLLDADTPPDGITVAAMRPVGRKVVAALPVSATQVKLVYDNGDIVLV